MTPADVGRVSWTDWDAVRPELGAVGLDADSSPGEVRSFLDEAFSDDLSSMSALVTSEPVLQQELGFSPATLEWQLFDDVSLMATATPSTTTPGPRPTSWWPPRAAYIRSPVSRWARSRRRHHRGDAGREIVLDLRPEMDYVLSALTSGPVLFATC